MSRTAAIIGGGPAGLMAAEILAAASLSVTVYDRMPSLARKFLMAGRGGLNLTHSEPLDTLLTRYGTASEQLEPFIRAFPPAALRGWCEGLGQKTFVGTSGRVFPVGLKASPLLRAWLKRLNALNVKFALSHEWRGWDDEGRLIFKIKDDQRIIASPDVTIVALGGASWPRLGSDGKWAALFRKLNVPLAPFQPANCGFTVEWSDIFRNKYAGQPLKSIALSFDTVSVSSEAMLTEQGIEGGAVYALSAPLREAIHSHGHAILKIDLKPDVPIAQLEEKLEAPRGSQSLSNYLRKTAALSPIAVGLIQEMLHNEKIVADTPQKLAALIKAVPLRLTGTTGIGRAISSTGGVKWEALDKNLMIKTLPGVFAAGEMLDWEAPTGGYLLQASYSTAAWAAHGAINWLEQNPIKA